MRPLIEAELLRLRTVRMPLFVALGALMLVVASNAAPIGGAAPSSPEEVTAQLRGLVQMGVFFASAFAALSVGDGFQRGEVAMTYAAHPRRDRVAAAHSIAYAGVGVLLAAIASAAALAIVLPVAAADHVNTGFSATDIALTIGRAAFTGAIFGAVGALLGALTRHSTFAVGAAVVWEVVETLITRGGTADGEFGRYLPIQLVGSATGLSNDVPAIAAMGILLAYLAAFGLVVRQWALPRDLT